jgi:hypothetical protein
MLMFCSITRLTVSERIEESQCLVCKLSVFSAAVCSITNLAFAAWGILELCNSSKDPRVNYA